MRTAHPAVVSLSREQLYEQVWTTAMRALAKRYGLSDVGLAKICKRHGIPRPPVGYWAKREVGKAPPRPPLPPLAAGATPQAIELIDGPAAVDTPAFDPEIASRLAAEAAAGPIVVPDAIRSWHPLVAQTRTEWKRSADESRARRAGDSWAIPERTPAATLNVHGRSKGNSERAMRVMDTLIMALESRGHEVTIKPDRYKPQTLVRVLDRKFQLRIYEPTVRQAQEPTREDIDRRKRYPHLTWRQDWIAVDSGKLELQVINEDGWRILMKWRDGSRRQIEAVLGDVVVGLLRLIDTERRESAEYQKRMAPIWEAERLRRVEAERLAKLEEEKKLEDKKIERLFKEAAAWRRSEELRAYLRALRAKAIQLHGSIEPGSRIDLGLAWAESIAERFDPLSPPQAAPAPVPKGPP